MHSPARIYFDRSRARISEQVHIPAMGLHERMPPGLIRHGGAGSGHPCLIMLFHTEASSLSPDGDHWLPAGRRFIVWPAEAWHHYGHEDKAWDHSWLHVSGHWIERTLRHTPIPLGVPLDFGGCALPLRYLRMISDELRGRIRPDPEMLQGLLQIFWRDMERSLLKDPGGGRVDPRLERARRFIEAHFDHPFSLVEAAGKAHLSPSHFCVSFSRQFGVPPREYAMRLRLQRGLQLLANRDLAVFQVAEKVGCPDALYFSRLFRRRYGMSPMQFRQRQQPPQRTGTP